MNRDVDAFLGCRTWAVVGASAKAGSFGTYAMKILKEKGFELFPVNPNYTELNGVPCFGSLNDLPTVPDAALFLLPPWAATAAVADAQKLGIKKIWFQRGADYKSAMEEAAKAGIAVMTDKCILMYAEPVKGIHAIHRFFSRLTGHTMLS
jgi:uncharacterized protein